MQRPVGGPGNPRNLEMAMHGDRESVYMFVCVTWLEYRTSRIQSDQGTGDMAGQQAHLKPH